MEHASHKNSRKKYDLHQMRHSYVKYCIFQCKLIDMTKMFHYLVIQVCLNYFQNIFYLKKITYHGCSIYLT